MESDGKLFGKAVQLLRSLTGLGISMHAAGAGYFIVLSVFPSLVLLLGLLRYTGISVDNLTQFLGEILPMALMPAAKRLITGAYRNTSGMVISLSALVALWSASRGVYGLMRGLNTVYHRQENRRWLHIRGLSMLYTGLFLLVVLLTLTVDVFGTALMRNVWVGAFFVMLEQAAGLRFILLLGLQTMLFCAMFMALPDGGNRFLPSLPGALLSSILWSLFSRLYSWYVIHFTGYTNVFGSVYAVALSMLWLYICLCILFFGGAINEFLSGRRK